MHTPGSEGTFNLTPSTVTSGYGIIANVTLGNEQSFLMRVDTGSSDTWVAGNSFICLNANQKEIDQAECNFGPTYTISPSFTLLPGLDLDIIYGDGSQVAVGLDTEAVAVGDITVANQSITFVTEAIWISQRCFVLAFLISKIAWGPLNQWTSRVGIPLNHFWNRGQL